MVNKCIDAHHHLWRYVPAEYPWMTDGMEILRRDFLLGDLKAVTAPAGIAGTVVVFIAVRQYLYSLDAQTGLAESICPIT
jgi:predicted TIM-barrel fold metal-dependent hydrolase